MHLTLCKWQICCQCRGREGGRAVPSVPTFQELQEDPPQPGEGGFDVSRKFGTWFFLLSRKAEDLGQGEGGFVLGQGGVTSFTLPGGFQAIIEGSTSP